MAKKNEEGLGKLQKDALRFVRKYPGWHSYEKKGVTPQVIKALEKRGLVRTNKYSQFTAVR